MALPLTAPTSAQIYANLSALASTLKSDCASVQQAASIGNVNCQMVLRLLNDTVALLTYAQQIAADSAVTASLVAYMGTTGASTTTATTDFANSIAALQALVAAIAKDYPVDANGHMLDHTLNATTGAVSWLSLTPAQLSNTLPAITAWLATVD